MLRCFAVALALAAAPSLALNATVANGQLSVNGGASIPIAPTFTALQGAIDAYFRPLPPSPAANHSLLNSSDVSFLVLNGGAFTADAPLALVDALILVLNDVDVAPAADFSNFRGLIELNGTRFAGVVSPAGPAGARFSCGGAARGVTPAAVWGVNASDTVVDGLSVFACGQAGGGAIHLQGAPGSWAPTAVGATVTNCKIWNASRAIWLETLSGVAVHGNEIFNNSGHALDFDAFTHHSTATGNNIYGNYGREGIFIEQGAVGITVAGNTIGPGNGNGVAVYNNAMNLTTGPHYIVANQIFGNLNAGIAVGSTAPRAGTPDTGVYIAGNTLHGNGGDKPQGYHSNGAQEGVRYACNANADGVSLFTTSFKVRAWRGAAPTASAHLLLGEPIQITHRRSPPHRVFCTCRPLTLRSSTRSIARLPCGTDFPKI